LNINNLTIPIYLTLRRKFLGISSRRRTGPL